MTGTARLSVVVVHWNVPDLLRACLATIPERVRDIDVETIVVDNASPGGDVREVIADACDVRLISLKDNRGYAAGCNAGIVAATGDAVLLLNPDTELLPGALETLWDTLHVAPHIGMVAPLLLNSDGSLQSSGYRFPGVANLFFDLFPVHPRLIASPLNGRVPQGDGVQPIRIDYPLGAVMLARRAAIDDVGPLDEAYGMYSEEIDWARRFAERGWTVLLAPAARVIHHAGSSTAQRPAEMHEALWNSRARYLERWGTRRQRRLASLVVKAGTTWQDRRADDGQRAANARIRARFKRLAASE